MLPQLAEGVVASDMEHLCAMESLEGSQAVLSVSLPRAKREKGKKDEFKYVKPAPAVAEELAEEVEELATRPASPPQEKPAPVPAVLR